MAYEGNIQWFPGHMTKTRRMIEENLKMVDAVVEIVDGRIPEASRNPIINELVKDKPRILVLNKIDYADDNVTKKWQEYYMKQGYSVLQCDCKSGKGINKFLPLLKNLLAELLEKRRAKGMIGKALRIMVLGIPNVGKSSFINRLANSRKTKVEDRPGVTRGKQWVTIDKEVELLDMPGILWPKFEDKEVALKLAVTGAIKDDVLDVTELAMHLASLLRENYSQQLKLRYKIENDEVEPFEILVEIARVRGMLVSRGEPDIERAAVSLIDEYRSGKIGKISLERPV